MKVLVLTRAPWNDSNSTGNTMSNLFGGWQSDEIAGVQLRAGRPSTEACENIFSIGEGSLLKSAARLSSSVGTTVADGSDLTHTERPTILSRAGTKAYELGRTNGSVIGRVAREGIWRFGQWKGPTLGRFVINFAPDVVFSAAFGALYPHDVLWHMAEISGARVALYHCDDNLNSASNGTTHSGRYARLIAARVLESARRADLNFAISEEMVEKYEERIRRPVEFLVKGGVFDPAKAPWSQNPEEPIRIVYAGSLLYGRWKTLSMLVDSIRLANSAGIRVVLELYSQYAPSDQMLTAIHNPPHSEFKGNLPADRVHAVLGSADVVLHVESLDRSEREKTALSFSTKIIDLLASRRGIMGIGWEQSASIRYLRKCPGAMVASSQAEVLSLISEISVSPGRLSEASESSFAFGSREHDLSATRERLRNRLGSLSE